MYLWMFCMRNIPEFYFFTALNFVIQVRQCAVLLEWDLLFCGSSRPQVHQVCAENPAKWCVTVTLCHLLSLFEMSQSSAADVFYRLFHWGTDPHAANRGQVGLTTTLCFMSLVLVCILGVFLLFPNQRANSNGTGGAAHGASRWRHLHAQRLSKGKYLDKCVK